LQNQFERAAYITLKTSSRIARNATRSRGRPRVGEGSQQNEETTGRPPESTKNLPPAPFVTSSSAIFVGAQIFYGFVIF
jgi:hypothetical protein